MEIPGQNPVSSLRPAPARVAGPPVDAKVPKLEPPRAPDDVVEWRQPVLPSEPERIEQPQPPKPAGPAPETSLPAGLSLGVNGTLFMEEPATFCREMARDTLTGALGEGWAKDHEVFYHGSSSGQARLDDDHLPHGRLFTSASLETAELFAHRKTGRVPGRPTMTAVAFERADYERIERLGLVKTKQVDDMPGKVETILHPDALGYATDFVPIPDASGRV
ncbi:MAG: hypothetical protein AB7S38_11950 [Vulcanimicrobiota bacterium]